MNLFFLILTLLQLMFTFGWIGNSRSNSDHRRILRNSYRVCETELFSSPDSWHQHQAAGVKGSLDDDDVIAAAAAVTKESSPLLGLRSIGVDYGLARTGLAFTIGFAPQQLTIIEEVNATLVVEQVIRYAQSEGASQIILGLPLHKNGTESEQTGLTRTFGNQLARKAMSTLGKVPVILWDERYTSKEAAARVHAQDPGRALRGILDAEAACIILENYYYDDGKGAEEIQLEEDVIEACLGEFKIYKEEFQRQRQAVLEKRDANLQRRQEMLDRSRQVHESAGGPDGLSSTKKKKKKKK
jgi:putative transcription antitermination factor YqgF